jgi:acylphosphatase
VSARRPASQVRRRVVVRGRVQGVAFRAHTQAQARRLGLVGWVRNRDDGAVELEVRGPSEQVAQLLAWCRQGPPLARIDELEHHDLPADDRDAEHSDDEPDRDFVIRR